MIFSTLDNASVCRLVGAPSLLSRTWISRTGSSRTGSSRASVVRASILALVLASVLTGAPSRAAGTATLVQVGDGERPVAEHVAGDDLHVALDGAAPGTTYRLTLVDETETVIAEEIATADETGRAASLLWFRSGVVGCDPTSQPDPALYRFRDFDQAEAVLAGERRFEVRVVEAATGAIVEERSLPVKVDTSKPRFFFADGSGCPRSTFVEGEALYLGARGLAGDGQDAVVFLVDGSFVPALGESLRDVRPEYSAAAQTISIDPGQTSFTELLWVAPEPGDYGAVVRLDDILDPRFRDGDDWIGGSHPESGERSPHGITISPWDCPGCNDPVDDTTNDDTGGGG